MRGERSLVLTANHEMEAVLEAILFAASEPVPRDRLLAVFEEDDVENAAEALDRVVTRFRQREGGGVMLEEVGGGLRLATRPEVYPYLRKFFQTQDRNRLSMAALETLAIIAYRQPVTGPEVQELRGVQSSSVVKTLLERRLVRISGRKAVVGKPFLYATTKEFLLHFGLASLEDLPPLEEFEEALAAEGGGDVGVDREEQILRQAAEIDDAEMDDTDLEDLDSEESEHEPEG